MSYDVWFFLVTRVVVRKKSVSDWTFALSWLLWQQITQISQFVGFLQWKLLGQIYLLNGKCERYAAAFELD